MIKPKSISYQIPQQMFLIEAVPSWMHVIMWGEGLLRCSRSKTELDDGSHWFHLVSTPSVG